MGDVGDKIAKNAQDVLNAATGATSAEKTRIETVMNQELDAQQLVHDTNNDNMTQLHETRLENAEAKRERDIAEASTNQNFRKVFLYLTCSL